MELQSQAKRRIYFKMPKIKEIDKKTPEQMEKIIRFAQKPLGFLLLAGANGTGKSFVAEAIYELHTPYKLPYYDKDIAYFISQSDLNEKWLDEKSQGSSKELSERLKGTKLLVLDDLGVRTPSEAFLDFLFSLIDHRWRYRDTLGTIITTNMTGKVTRDKFGDPILSRIASGIQIRFDGEDRRIIDF